MLIGLLLAASAFVTERTLEMKTYPFSDPDPVPAVEKTRYPYFFFDGTTSASEMRAWKAVVLENERIRVTLVPEIGGKIWGVRDKRTGKDVVYHNHVVKFRNISQRGPWCSGGIEFNFGIIGHGPWTATPVSYFVRTNDDASVSCFVSETELVTLATWQVEVNLKPDAEGFTTRTIWFNGSGLQMPYYQWMNAAFPLDRDPTFEFPGRAYIGHDGDSHPWPVEDGHNLLRYSGNAFGGPKSEHVVNGDNGFYGIWWPEKDGQEAVGFVHSNHVTQKYGRKVWLWALSRDGAIWEDLLTDSDGQYTELQSGRAFNQPRGDTYLTPFKHPTFAPGATEVFEEDWSVVRDRAVFERAWKPENFADRPLKMPKDFKWDTAYGHYVVGQQMLRQRMDREAEPELLKSVAKDPYFVPALGQLAMLAVRRAEYAKAHDWATRALSVDTYDAAANYYDGLAFAAEGLLRRAKERLGLAAYSPEFRSAALATVARLELREGDFAAAETLADQALLANGLNLDAILVKLVVRRLSGDRDGAKRLATDVLACVPLFHAARYELSLAAGGDGPFDRYLRNELPQETYLSLGTWYEEAGRTEDAALFFGKAGARTAIGLIRAAYVAHGQGDDARAKELLEKADGMSVDFALPFRRETLPALRWARTANPSWKFAYLEAVLLAAFARDDEANALLEGCGEKPDSATFYLFRASRRTGDAALADLRRAAKFGDSWRVGNALYLHFSKAGNWKAACAEVERYIDRLPSNILNIDYANALARSGRPAEAIAFMEKTEFLPSEHGDNASGAWLDACRLVAAEALKKGDRKAAEDVVRKAAAYPENLGVGRPYDLNFKPGKGGRRNPLADWTGELREMLLRAFGRDTRPYEFVNAKRTKDEIPPWIDFERETGWTGETATGGVVRVERSQERQLFGDWTLAVPLDASEVRVRPSAPLPLPTKDFDRMGVWIRGLRIRRVTPVSAIPSCSAVFRLADGSRREVSLLDTCWAGGLWWSDWHYVVTRFKDADLVELRKDGAAFDGFVFRNCTGGGERTTFLDNIAFFRDGAAPLALKPHRTDLPFPTRKEGAMPSSAADGSRNSVVTNGTDVTYSYEGPDGRLVYTWPRGRGFEAVTASWNGGAPFRPMAGGGVKGGTGAYACSIRGKTLVIDVTAAAGTKAVSFGAPDRSERELTVPMYYDGWGRGRSRVTLTDGVFSHAFSDWYRSRASSYDEWREDTVTNRAAAYHPKTDGTYNAVRECVYLTVSPAFAEVLPVIANPVSPWKHVTGTHAWNSYASTADRARDRRFWRGLWRLGVRDMVITDHEVCFRDGGESFTFRLDAAPGKGGDKGLRDWTSFLIGELGYWYGPYNNFTDFAPANANWSLNRVGRRSDGSLTPAWMRCYSPKSPYAAEACAYYAPRLKEKFGFNAAYCDVHTAVFPWTRTDYDARVPGAATFAEVYYNYGDVLLTQRRAWNGPVYSEGTCQFLYAGLTDGNYAQARMDADKDPWIVDFNLTRINPLECDFGMGNPGMFAPKRETETDETRTDRFLAAELAFGNSPYLITDCLWKPGNSHGPGYLGKDARATYRTGLPILLNSYYLALPLARRYTQSKVAAIRYAAADGRLLGTSDAICSGAIDRQQVVVTYADGTTVAANGSRTERMDVIVGDRRVDLPPTGFAGWNAADGVEVLSSDAGGTRTDYAAAPEAIYLNTRTAGYRTFAKARGDGVAVCRREKDGSWELIPVRGHRFAFAVPGEGAVALDEEGRELSPAKLVRDGEFVSVEPVDGAFSYRIKSGR